MFASNLTVDSLPGVYGDSAVQARRDSVDPHQVQQRRTLRCMPAVLIYTRLSTVDVHEATDRQEAACRSYAEARGWTVLDVLSDTASSAYDPRSKRPGFEALFNLAEHRTCDGVLVWKFDRLVRRSADFERLWSAAEQSRIFLASVMEPIDTSTPLGVALLRILVALAGLESATTGVRVAASKRQAAERGEHPPNKAYGLSNDWSCVDASEAAVLVECAGRALAGEPMNVIARDLQTRGIPAPKSDRWTGAALGRILTNPRLVGDRTYRGEVVARDCWPQVLDRPTFEQLQLTLARPGRQGTPRRHPRRLATGFARCGQCGHPLGTTTRSGVRYYSCPTHPTGCGRCHVRADCLEEWLLDQLAERLAVVAAPEGQPDKAAVSEALRRLARDYYADSVITREEFLATRAELERRVSRHDESRGAGIDVRRLVKAKNPRVAVGQLSIEQQRRLLADRLDHVVVSRTAAHAGRFDSRRLSCEWLPGCERAG